MKHCHFSILWNEITFLKQKLPFLYEHFDQIIFYDLNVVDGEPRFSDDGSHEYILNFPDKEGKIHLIERKDLSKVKPTVGASVVGKQRMFIFGSQYVRDDIDVFWCTDMDEFFNASLIEKVENVFSTEDAESISVRQYMFWKNPRTMLCFTDNDTRQGPVRIARHKKDNVYGHCFLAAQYTPVYEIKDEFFYHFAFVGEKRMKFKSKYHSVRNDFWDTWNDFDERKVGNEIYGHPRMHPNSSINMGVKKFYGEYPDYIDIKAIEDGS